jgi:hypothetical protein
VAQLVSQLTEQTSRLVRDEVELAKVELTSKAKQAGMGAGLFSAAGLLALYGFGALVATAILALALVMDAWLAALVVAVVLFAAAGVAALIAKNRLKKATPLKPEHTIQSVETDVREVKEARQRASDNT